ncbi:hypothetical protein BAZSYMA_ACONTIG220722_1 [Bathymodiolus azoricus thioautotrophic gill symbiont]|uniref:Uncharacterized protein n=1 Tax=Bathymodiolus azoricus thioautotrophic gill symbiont TaxID=235205 RepID=A0A1H6KW49_9GAMM|nr:hypothetical protein BAZSYMA_ACONTIG220722_1 [Bathymodiolus azoricus thioautotrophic gill symbiont]
MVVMFGSWNYTTYAISAYRHYCSEFESHSESYSSLIGL